MNRAEFLKEVLSSDICPENFESIYEDFKAYQQKALDTLCEFHRVCEKNGLRYQLAYGSLLGAVRDNGQIPWDYDIDVFVPYKDRFKLIEALKADLGKDFYFYCPEIDSKCRHFFMRVTPKGYKSEVLHVDVFYVVGAPTDDAERKSFCEQLKTLFFMRYDKLIKPAENSGGSFHNYAVMVYKKFKLLNTSADAIAKKFDALCTKYDFDEVPYSVGADYTAVKRHYDTKKMWNTVLYTTESGVFRIPENYDEILTSTYGDYKKIFPLKDRLDEMMLHYKSLKTFGK